MVSGLVTERGNVGLGAFGLALVSLDRSERSGSDGYGICLGVFLVSVWGWIPMFHVDEVWTAGLAALGWPWAREASLTQMLF